MRRFSNYYSPGFIFALIVGCFPVVTLFAPKGAVLLFSFAVLSLLLRRLKSGPRLTRPSLVFWLLAIFFGYSMASSAWSTSPLDSISTLLGMVLILLSVWLAYPALREFSAEESKFFSGSVIFGGALSLLLMGLEIVTDGSSSEFIWSLGGKSGIHGKTQKLMRPGTITLALYMWPWAWLILDRFGKYWAVAAVSSALSILAIGESSAALLATGLGAGAALLVLIIKTKFVRILAGVCVLFILSAPFIPSKLPDPLLSGKKYTSLSNSAVHRIVIWQVTARHILENPVFGIGLDGARSLYPPSAKETIVFIPDVPSASWYITTEAIPLHPHNLALQVWLELGAVGAILLSAIVFTLLITASKIVQCGDGIACTVGLFSSIFVIANISFGAWQSWWLAAISLIALICFCSCIGTLPSNGHRKNRINGQTVEYS